MTGRALNGWTLGSLTYSGANASQVNVDLANRSVTIDLAADEHLTCTFANKEPCNLTIVKAAVPRDGTDFTFDLSGSADSAIFGRAKIIAL